MDETTLLSLNSLQLYLTKKFQEWKPKAPAVVERTKRSVTLRWLEEETFGFLEKHLLYKVQRKEKIPHWVTVYSGGKTTKTIESLAPSHPHKFRLQVILKSTAVTLLAEEAMKYYGDVDTIHTIMDKMETENEKVLEENCKDSSKQPTEVATTETTKKIRENSKETEETSTKSLTKVVEQNNSGIEGTNETLFCITKEHPLISRTTGVRYIFTYSLLLYIVQSPYCYLNFNTILLP